MSTYKGIIAEIRSIVEIPNANTIQVAKVMGENVIVSKDFEVGMVGVFFPADTVISEWYLKENNLYRHSEKNKDEAKTGFFDDNGRVRAQPFMKVKSDGYFAPLDSLTGDVSKLKIGDQLEEWNGQELAKKYISPKTQKQMAHNNKKVAKKEQVIGFEKHMDTDQFKYYVQNIPKGALISIQAKVHGTSARMAYLPVVREKTGFWDKIRSFIAKSPLTSTSYEYVVGTRNVTLLTEDNDKESFHGSEQFRYDALDMVKPFLEKGMTIYGEIAGFANGVPIMGRHNSKVLKDKKFTKKYGEEITYTYGCKEHEFRFHIYRITYTNAEGKAIDFTEQQIHQWCDDRGINAPVEVCEPFIYDGDQEALMEKVELLTERDDCLTEDYIDPSHPSEGVIVRVDHGGLQPKFYKSKSRAFKVLEGIWKDSNVDIEDAS